MHALRAWACGGLFLLLSTGSLHAQETSLQRAVRLTGEGQLTPALAAARAGEDPLSRAQGELYVLHHAGALEAALEAGLAGLREAPGDTWLLERSAYIALSLGAGELSARLSEELRETLPASEWARHEWMLSEAQALESTRAEEAAALQRAQLVSAGVGLLAVALMLALGARRGQPTPA